MWSVNKQPSRRQMFCSCRTTACSHGQTCRAVQTSLLDRRTNACLSQGCSAIDAEVPSTNFHQCKGAILTEVLSSTPWAGTAKTTAVSLARPCLMIKLATGSGNTAYQGRLTIGVKSSGGSFPKQRNVFCFRCHPSGCRAATRCVAFLSMSHITALTNPTYPSLHRRIRGVRVIISFLLPVLLAGCHQQNPAPLMEKPKPQVSYKPQEMADALHAVIAADREVYAKVILPKLQSD